MTHHQRQPADMNAGKFSQMMNDRKSRVAAKAVLITLAAGWLAGCAVGPDYKTLLPDTPARWTHSASRSDSIPQLSRWWLRLNDPVLNQVIEEAVAGNLDVAAAKAKIREARAAYRQAIGALFPVISNSESISTNRSATTAVAGTGTNVSTSPYTLVQAGFDASWELDLFGANRRGAEAALYGADAADDELQATLLTLIGDVASYYVQVRGYQARIALARNTANSQDETAKITRNKLDAGSTSAVDVANAEGQAASTRASIPTLETALSETVHSLSILTGQPPTALEGRLSRARSVPAPGRPIPPGIPADILLNRADVRLAERQYAQATAKIGQAEAALYPSVSLTGSIATTGTKFGDLGKSSSVSWALGPTLTVPIFNGGKLRAAVDIAQAQRDQYFVAYQSAVLNALKDVENALVAFSREQRRARSLSVSTTAYQRAATLSRSLYQLGSASFLDVLTAERSLYSANDALIQSRVLIATDYIALHKALGGGWDRPVNSSAPEIVDVNTGPHPIQPVSSGAVIR